MRIRLHHSFAARLIAGGVVLVLCVLGGVSAFLLISRVQQTGSVAVSNADNRAQVVKGLLERLTAPTGRNVATDIARSGPLATALGPPASASAVNQLFGTGQFNPRGQWAAVVAADGTVVFSSLPAGLPPVSATLASVRGALAKQTTVQGVEILGKPPTPRIAAYDTAAPITSAGQVVGVVLMVAPLADQLDIYQPVVGYPVAFVAADDPATIARLDARARSGPAPAAIADAVAGRSDIAHGTYPAPLTDGSSDEVAGSFIPLNAPDGSVAGYVGVEAPTAFFAGDIRGDVIALVLISIFVILLTAALVILVVVRFVTRPVARLERGVARIAGGDYATDIPVSSNDELGRLAAGVNRMRAEIADNIRTIEAARERLDRAVEQLAGVSRALTTTTAGVPALQEAVVDAAAAIAGLGSAAVLLTREDGDLVTAVACGVDGGSPSIAAWNVIPELLAGRAVRVDDAPEGWRAGGMIAVPMFYQDDVVGALAVITRAGRRPIEEDAQGLAVLANSAAIALENTRLFEQERETVRRLRELDAMKSDFLATVQHELRTPLTAILGMADLLEMCWDGWDDAAKLDAITDVQVAARNLYDIVETIIDFSMLEAESLGLNPQSTSLRGAVDEAVGAIGQRRKGGLGVDITVSVPEELEVFADPGRLRQVMQALVDNAVKFTPNGGHVQVLSESNGDGMVRIDVLDDGIGIPADAVARIFDRFYQVDNSVTRRYSGTGMGLALVHRLVEAHGASVDVESREGKGSRFSLHWPARAVSSAGEARDVARERGDL